MCFVCTQALYQDYGFAGFSGATNSPPNTTQNPEKNKPMTTPIHDHATCESCIWFKPDSDLDEHLAKTLPQQTQETRFRHGTCKHYNLNTSCRRMYITDSCSHYHENVIPV